jgi:hypothetical protein
MHYSDRGWWAACGRAAQEKPVDRASLKGGDSDAPAKREADGGGAHLWLARTTRTNRHASLSGDIESR